MSQNVLILAVATTFFTHVLAGIIVQPGYEAPSVGPTFVEHHYVPDTYKSTQNDQTVHLPTHIVGWPRSTGSLVHTDRLGGFGYVGPAPYSASQPSSSIYHRYRRSIGREPDTQISASGENASVDDLKSTDDSQLPKRSTNENSEKNISVRQSKADHEVVGKLLQSSMPSKTYPGYHEFRHSSNNFVQPPLIIKSSIPETKSSSMSQTKNMPFYVSRKSTANMPEPTNHLHEIVSVPKPEESSQHSQQNMQENELDVELHAASKDAENRQQQQSSQVVVHHTAEQQNSDLLNMVRSSEQRSPQIISHNLPSDDHQQFRDASLGSSWRMIMPSNSAPLAFNDASMNLEYSNMEPLLRNFPDPRPHQNAPIVIHHDTMDDVQKYINNQMGATTLAKMTTPGVTMARSEDENSLQSLYTYDTYQPSYYQPSYYQPPYNAYVTADDYPYTPIVQNQPIILVVPDDVMYEGSGLQYRTLPTFLTRSTGLSAEHYHNVNKMPHQMYPIPVYGHGGYRPTPHPVQNPGYNQAYATASATSSPSHSSSSATANSGNYQLYNHNYPVPVLPPVGYPQPPINYNPQY